MDMNIDPFPYFKLVVEKCFDWLNATGFTFAGHYICLWDVFLGGTFISLAGMIFVNLMDTSKGD